MLTNPKLKSVFSLYVDDIDFVADVSSFVLKSDKLDAKQITFGKYTQGMDVKWTLGLKGLFDGGSAGSLHDYLWNNAGRTVTFILKPFQGFDPNTKRYYTGQVRIPYRPDISVKAGQYSTFDYEFKVVGHPSRGDQPNGFMTTGYYDSY
ncbi:major tail protein [Rhodococcus phage Weasels2]|uniref:Major tail protein n=1 Tax=Rhodococcus phage Weasels2 TaxID=1897437 RepID=A0A1I9SA55_9CAUD|nr:major tail protein [Rhodococcus phage Weasels2]AOZ63661.1 major tail protein [Rhodococcus phage Weasels2]